MDAPSYAEHYAMDSWTRFDQGPAMYGEQTIVVVDPATRKLCIPISAVIPTQALHRLDRVPSICMLYLQNRCRQGMNCHQLHADPAIVESLRSEVVLRTSCCPDHGEEVTQPCLSEVAPDVTVLLVEGHRVSPHRVATTNGMRRLMMERQMKEGGERSSEVQLLRAQVCRLHVQGRCRYAEDCNFIHLCRSLTDGEAPELSRLLSSAVTNTPSKFGRSFNNNFNRSINTPSSAYVPPMPPSPLYAGMPQSPMVPPEHMVTLDHNEDSHGTTPPTTPSQPGARLATPLSGSWRHEPYSWNCVSPVRCP